MYTIPEDRCARSTSRCINIACIRIVQSQGVNESTESKMIAMQRGRRYFYFFIYLLFNQ